MDIDNCIYVVRCAVAVRWSTEASGTCCPLRVEGCSGPMSFNSGNVMLPSCVLGNIPTERKGILTKRYKCLEHVSIIMLAVPSKKMKILDNYEDKTLL